MSATKAMLVYAAGWISIGIACFGLLAFGLSLCR